MLIQKALAFFFALLIGEGSTAVPKCLDTTLTVTAEFFEQSVKSASSHVKVITKSSEFTKNFNSLAVSAEISIGFKAFSGSAKSAYEEATEASRRSAESRHEEKSVTTTYSPNELQIIRKVTTVVSIAGKRVQTVDQEFVDTVPSSKHLTPDQLHQRAVDYIQRRFGYLANQGGTVIENTYTANNCLPVRKEFYAGVRGGLCNDETEVIRSKEECTDALQKLGYQPLSDWWTGEYSLIPSGCSVREGSNAPHFEKSSTGVGSGREDLIPICIRNHELSDLCNQLPQSMNGPNFPKGCQGAVYQSGNPARKYCQNDNGLYSWWQACCYWDGTKCVPKGSIY